VDRNLSLKVSLTVDKCSVTMVSQNFVTKKRWEKILESDLSYLLGCYVIPKNGKDRAGT